MSTSIKGVNVNRLVENCLQSSFSLNFSRKVYIWERRIKIKIPNFV